MNTLATCAAARTSSLVTSPETPVALTFAISTFISLASLRIGGLAKTTSAVGTTAIKSVPGAVAFANDAAAATGATPRLLLLGAAADTP